MTTKSGVDKKPAGWLLPVSLLKEVEHLAIDEECGGNVLAERFIRSALTEYREGRISHAE